MYGVVGGQSGILTGRGASTSCLAWPWSTNVRPGKRNGNLVSILLTGRNLFLESRVLVAAQMHEVVGGQLGFVGAGGAPSSLACAWKTKMRSRKWEGNVLSAGRSQQSVVVDVVCPTETTQTTAQGDCGNAGVSNAPLLDALRVCANQDVAAFHFPGHRRGGAAPPLLARAVGLGLFAHDLPELPELDNLFAPEGVIAEAQKKAARTFGADSTFFLVNGTTCGIQAAVMATCQPGDFLVVPRNCHLSVISAMILSGALPWYVMPMYDTKWAVGHGITNESVESALHQVQARGGKVGAVLIVSPTYYGICSPVAEIADICHRNNVPLIVDEAHGAHFCFHEELPSTALEQGADITVQSTHKVLGSLTQSSMLHVKDRRVDQDLLSRCLQMLQSSSPSYILLSSLDAARAQMSYPDDTGRRPSLLIAAALDLAAVARNRLKEIPTLAVMDRQTICDAKSVPGLDPLRVTVGLWALDVDGYEADDILRLEFGVIAELPTTQSITFAVSFGTTERDIDRLVDALRALSVRFSKRDSATDQAPPPSHCDGDCYHWVPSNSCLSPREAFFCKTRRVNTADAVGHVSAELLCPYPPGIPVILPGEVISADAIAYLRRLLGKGGKISGTSDPSLSTMFVCQM